jgi:fructosamine-3-kinase
MRRVGGGDINDAFHVRLANGSEAFVKTRAQAVPGEYATEAAGLEWLAQAGTVRVPRVLAIDEGYLALEWVARGTLSVDGVEEFGRGLAALHAAGAPHFGAPPNTSGNPRFGSLALSNEPTDDWPGFYAQRRLLPLARIGIERGALSPAGARAVESVCERIGELCGPPEPPARLHGDLWHGNVMAGEDGVAWLIDPSAYGGHREVDLAMLRLFGARSERVFASYGEVAPLGDGADERVGLYQLLPLLVHALLFGGSYVRAAEQLAERYAR